MSGRASLYSLTPARSDCSESDFNDSEMEQQQQQQQQRQQQQQEETRRRQSVQGRDALPPPSQRNGSSLLASSSDGLESPLSEEQVNQLENIGSLSEYEPVDGENDWLGRGSFGQVFKAREKRTGRIVAIKSVKLEGGVMPRTLIMEIKIAMQALCEHIVRVERLLCSKSSLFQNSEALMSDLNMKRSTKRHAGGGGDDEGRSLAPHERQKALLRKGHAAPVSYGKVPSLPPSGDDASRHRSQRKKKRQRRRADGHDDDNEDNDADYEGIGGRSAKKQKTCVYMVMELMEYRDVCLYTQSRHHVYNAPLLIREVKYVIQCLLLALEHLCDARGVMHRDVKTLNMLINKRGEVKLGDFGLALNYVPGGKYNTDQRVTRWYRPPEMFLGDQQYTPAIDVWSAGIVLLELLLGDFVFRGKEEQQMLNAIFSLCGMPKRDEWSCGYNRSFETCFRDFTKQYPTAGNVHQCRIPNFFEVVLEERFHQEIGAMAANSPHSWVAHERKRHETRIFSPLQTADAEQQQEAPSSTSSSGEENDKGDATGRSSSSGGGGGGGDNSSVDDNGDSGDDDDDVENDTDQDGEMNALERHERKAREIQRRLEEKKKQTVQQQRVSYEQWSRISSKDESAKKRPQQQTLFLPSQQRKIRAEIRKDYANLIDLATHMLDVNPTRRYTAKEALNHPFFQSGSEPCSPEEFANVYRLFAPDGKIVPRHETDMIAKDQQQKRAPISGNVANAVAAVARQRVAAAAVVAAAAAAAVPDGSKKRKRGAARRLDEVCGVGRAPKKSSTREQQRANRAAVMQFQQYTRLQNSQHARPLVGNIRYITDISGGGGGAKEEYPKRKRQRTGCN